MTCQARRRTRSTSKLNKGFTLLEVLAALLVLSIGMMGVLRAQTLSLRISQHGSARSHALLLATSVLDSIRGNRDAARAYITALPLADSSSLDAAQCDEASSNTSETCEALGRARQDLDVWSRLLTGSASALGHDTAAPVIPDAMMEITEVSGRFTVRVDWTEQSAFSSITDTSRGASLASKRVLSLSAAIPL